MTKKSVTCADAIIKEEDEKRRWIAKPAIWNGNRNF
jgi:hypothetical protein